MEYINRRGQTYFAFQGQTKTGKPKYFASQKSTSEKASRIDSLPPDFEFYESPSNATVTIRRRKKSRVTVAEKNLLERLCLELTSCDCQVAIEKDALVVYVAPKPRMTTVFEGMHLPGMETLIHRHRNHDPELRLTLDDAQRRTFSAERYCYRSSIDGWMELHRPPKDLEVLAKSLLPHLGEESFFELF